MALESGNNKQADPDPEGGAHEGQASPEAAPTSERGVERGIAASGDGGAQSVDAAHPPRAPRVRLLVASLLGIGVVGLIMALWKDGTPPIEVEIGAPVLPSSTTPDRTPPALSRMEVSAPVEDAAPDRFREMRARRERPEWKVVAGIARGADSILGVRCDFDALDAEGAKADIVVHRGPAEIFLLEIPREARTLQATPVGRFHLDRATITLPDKDLDGVEILLPQATGVLSGRVVDPEGAAVEDVRVNLANSRGRRTTDAAGMFVFRQLRDESYSVQVNSLALSSIGTPAQTVAVENGVQQQSVLFVVERGATLTGRCIGSSDSAPIGGVTVSLAQTGGSSHRSAITDQDGDFLFSRLAAGDYELIAAQVEGTYGRVIVPVPALRGDEMRDVTVEMSSSAGSVLGRVKDVKTGPLPFARVLATRTGPSGDVQEQLQTTTDSSGRFRFVGISAGPWSLVPEDLWCRSRNWVAEAPTPVLVQDGFVREVELQVRSGAYLKGTVTSASGKKGLRVRVSAPDGTSDTHEVSVRGQFLIAGLKSGTYTVEAIDPAHPTEVLHRTRVYASAEDPGEATMIVP